MSQDDIETGNAHPFDKARYEERIAELEAALHAAEEENKRIRRAMADRIFDLEAERERLREFVEHVAKQQTILIGNPYNSLARAALSSTQEKSPAPQTKD